MEMRARRPTQNILIMVGVLHSQNICKHTTKESQNLIITGLTPMDTKISILEKALFLTILFMRLPDSLMTIINQGRQNLHLEVVAYIARAVVNMKVNLLLTSTVKLATKEQARTQSQITEVAVNHAVDIEILFQTFSKNIVLDDKEGSRLLPKLCASSYDCSSSSFRTA